MKKIHNQQSLEQENPRQNDLNQYDIDDLSILYRSVNQCQTFNNQKIRLRGGGNIQDNHPKQQENVTNNNTPIVIFNEQDIFQFIQYHTTLLQRILENQINQKEIDQLKKVVHWINSKGIIYKLSNQGKLDERNIFIIMNAIDILLSCVIKTPIQLSHDLLQFTQNLFQILYSQVKIFKSNIIQNLYIFQNNLQLINQKYQQEKGLQILFNYQLCLMKDVIDYKFNERAQIEEKFIFEQNEGIFIKFQEGNRFLQDPNSLQYDIYYFFQQLKLTIIRIVLNQYQKIDVQQIVNQLCNGYQLCIQNNKNWRVHQGFLQMLLELISYENSFIEDLQICSVTDIIIIPFNELSTQLMGFQIQDKFNIWEHYIKTECNTTIKCYLAFSFMLIRKNQNLESHCQQFINLFLNSDQDENTISILKNEKLNVIQETFEPPQQLLQQLSSYKQLLKTHLIKLQENFIFNKQGLNQININLKVQNVDNQNSNKINYLFKENTYFGIEESVVNDFLWTGSNNTEVLWIEGMAGSGKSNFLRRLQLFLLKDNISNYKQKKWIPLYIQMATIKELNDNIWSQILQADDLQFNDEFIRNLNDDVENEQVNIVLLFDGLDEMKHKIQFINLIQNNSLFQKKLGKNLKVIITSRKEDQIETQFIGSSFKLLTKFEIQNLDEALIGEYLKQSCIEGIRQYLQNIYQDSKISRIQFNEYWEAFFLEEIKTLVEKASQQQYIWSDELIYNMISKLTKIFDFNDSSSDHFSQLLIDFKKMQNQSELMKIINKNEIINLIQTPQALQIILSILKNINQLTVNKKNRKQRLKDMILKLKNEQIKQINQLEQAKQFNEKEQIDNLMISLQVNKFFDDFSFENLNNQIMQISEDDLNLIKFATEQTEFTQYQIYKLFVSQYHEKQINKLKDIGNFNISEHFLRDLNKFQMLLAVYMIKQDKLYLESKEVESIMKSYFNQNNLDETYNILLLKSSNIIKLKNGNYQFKDKSFNQYFVGKYILRLIKDFSRDFSRKSIELNLEQSQFNQNEFNLSLDQFNQVITNIKPELLNYQDIKRILIKIIILSRDERFVRAASNSILLINFLRFELIGEDLRKIKLSRTNLSGLNFFGSNLDESVFNEVIIDYCNFNNTTLQGVKWTQTPWNNVIAFKDYNSEQVCEMVFSLNTQFLISWSEYSVNIWNLQTQKLHKRINYNLKLRSCIFSSDSTLLLLDFEYFQQIYYIKNSDIRLVLTIPLFIQYPFTFYNCEQKLIYSQNKQWYSYNLKKIIQSQTEWNKSVIFDHSTKFTFVKQLNYGQVLIGIQDGQIIRWDQGVMKPISKNVHKSAIVSLIQAEFQKKVEDQNPLQEGQKQVSLLISASEEEQVIFQLYSDYDYQQVKALPSQKINGQLPRYLNFNEKDLILIRNEYIIFYDLKKIEELKEDIIFKDAYCIAFSDKQITNQPIFDELFVFVAKDHYIEVYGKYNKCKTKIPLNNCQPLSMHCCYFAKTSPSYMIIQDKNETIRFVYIDENEYQYQYYQMNPSNTSHLIEGSIKGYVQNLKQSYTWILDAVDTIKIAVQKNKKKINIYKVQLSRDNIIIVDKIHKEPCTEDQKKIGCFALFQDGNRICLGVDNLIKIIDLENDQTTKLPQIHEKDIYQIMLNNKEKYMVSCSLDNTIIWYDDDFQKYHCLQNEKCLDLIFESENVLILQNEKSIIWYQIQQDYSIQVLRYFDFQQNGINNIIDQQMTIVQMQPKVNPQKNDEDQYQQQYQNFHQYTFQQQQQFVGYQQYLAIKQGENIILKQLLQGDQTKVVIFNQQDKHIEFVNKQIIIYTIKSSNTLYITDIDDMKIIKTVEFHAFAIKEHYDSQYLIIAIETKDEIKVMKIQKQDPIKTVIINKKNQGYSTHFKLSDYGNFLVLTNNQEITIYQITQKLQIIQISKLIIDFEIEDINISDTYEIIVKGQNCLYYYQQNQGEQIYQEQSNNPIGFTGQNQNQQIQALVDSDQLNISSNLTRLNHNDELLAISRNYYNGVKYNIDFISLKNKQRMSQHLQANFFSTSIDCKYFLISLQNRIDYYDWQEQINCLYSFDYEYNLIFLRILKDPNQIVAISSQNIQIRYCKENQIKQIKGRFYKNTIVSPNLDVAKIEQSIIQICKPEINIELYNSEDYDFKAKNPSFTQDGQYLVYESNNNVIFQSLYNPHSKYIPKNLQGQTHVSLFPESNYLITFSKEYTDIQTQHSLTQKAECYLHVWDLSVLSNIKWLFKLPILQHQTKKMFKQQCFISEIKNNILCIYDIKELQKDIYDKNLYNDIKNVHYAGICPNETKFFCVSKVDQSITIWKMKTQEKLQEFKGIHKNDIIFIGFSEDEKFMISRDRDQIIVWNMFNGQKLIIQDPQARLIGFQQGYLNDQFKNNQCNFVKLENSLGIAFQSLGYFYIYDLKDFKSCSEYHRMLVNPNQYQSFRYQIYSNGSKVCFYQIINDYTTNEIYIFDIRKKQVVEKDILSIDERFFGSPDSDSYDKKKIDKKYDDIGRCVDNNYFYVYSKDKNLLQIFNVQDWGIKGANPLHEIFIHLNKDYANLNSYDTLIQLNYVGKKYITYFYNQQLRVIDLELYKKQVKIKKLDESESFLQFYSKNLILFETSNNKQWMIYNLEDGSKKELYDLNINQFIVAFSNNSQDLAQGWNNGIIRLFKTNGSPMYAQWSCHKAIKHLTFTKDDNILISSSEDNIISFWNLHDYGQLIQQIQIDLNILSIVISPNGIDIALELEGDIIQILTTDKYKCYSQNSNYKYIGYYKSYPELQKFKTQNCIIGNSVIEDQNKKSLIHHFGEIIKQELESVTLLDEQQKIE